MAKRLNRDDVDKLHDCNLYIPSRLIWIGSEEHNMEHGESGVDGALAERTIKNLHILESISQEPIMIVMNNIGGDEYHCMAIIDAIKACKSHITIKVFGNAASAGSLILQAADERIMAPLSVQMIHYGTFGFDGHSKDFQKWATEGDRLDNWMEQYYLAKIRQKHPTFPLKKLKEMLDHDTFLTAAESVELGLADKILGDDEA